MSISHKIISLVLTIALVINPFEGSMAQLEADANAALVAASDAVFALGQMSQLDKTGEPAPSLAYSCCDPGPVGSCGDIDCQYSCAAALVQAAAVPLFSANHTYLPDRNTEAVGFEPSPAVPPPLTSVH